MSAQVPVSTFQHLSIDIVRRPRAERCKQEKESMNEKCVALNVDDYNTRKILDITSRIQGTMNQLTPHNFAKLLPQVSYTLDQINTDNDFTQRTDCLKQVVKVIFEKAVAEPSFSSIYANLCQDIAKKPGFVVQLSEEERVANMAKLKEKFPEHGEPELKRLIERDCEFRIHLITNCQEMFEDKKESEDKLDELSDKVKAATGTVRDKLKEEFNELEYSTKKKYLGNVKFIGELYKLGQIRYLVIDVCVKGLLDKRANVYDEEKLECLCILLRTIGGAKFETDMNKSKYVFTELASVVKSEDVTKRIVLMVEDILNLRYNRWDGGSAPSAPANVPTTIDQVDREAEAEEAEKRRKAEELIRKHPPRSNMSRERDQHRGMPRRTSNAQLQSITIAPPVFNGMKASPRVPTRLGSTGANWAQGAGQQTLRPNPWGTGSRALDAERSKTPTNFLGSSRGIAGRVGSGSNLSDNGIQDLLTSKPSITTLLMEIFESLKSSVSVPEKVYSWVDENVPNSELSTTKFVGDVTRVICLSSLKENSSKDLTLDTDLFDTYVPLLTKYVEHHKEMGAEVLLTCQRVSHELQNPSNMLYNMFASLYDTDAVSVSAFNEWKANPDPNGQGIALLATKRFFADLPASVES